MAPEVVLARTRSGGDDLGSLRNKALEAHILSEALAEELAELPAGSYSEKLQVLSAAAVPPAI